MNKLSTEIVSFETYVGAKEAIKLAKNAGFDCYNFDLCAIRTYDYEKQKSIKTSHPLSRHSYKKYLKDIKSFSDELGIICNQTHSPFPTDDIKILKAQRKAIRATKLLGAKIMVVHPDSFKGLEENVKIFKKIAKYALKHDVIIAIENIWNWSGTHAVFSVGSTPESLLELINKINEPNVGACLDIGHAEIMGKLTNSVQFIETLKNKLVATHIHDNDLVNDRHQIPFSGQIDFKSICKALKDNNYQGELTLEAIYYYKKNPDEGQKMVNNLYNAAVKIRDLMKE